MVCRTRLALLVSEWVWQTEKLRHKEFISFTSHSQLATRGGNPASSFSSIRCHYPSDVFTRSEHTPPCTPRYLELKKAWAELLKLHGILLPRGEGLVLLAEGLLDANSPHGEMLTRLWRDTCKHICNPWQWSLKCCVWKQPTKFFADRTKHNSIIMPQTKLKSYCVKRWQARLLWRKTE